MLQKDKEKGDAYDRALVQTSWPKMVESWVVNGKEPNENKRRDVQHLKVALTIGGSY